MSETNSEFFDIEQQVIQIDPEANVRTAVAAADRQLQMWRSCFTEGSAGGPIEKSYKLRDGSEVALSSSESGQVSIVHQPFETATSYGYAFHSDGTQIAGWEKQQEAIGLDEDPAVLCNRIGRLLYDATNAEAQG